VILGRSGFAILQGFADVLNVRIQSPFAVRVNRVMVQQALTAGQAEALVRDNDKTRTAFVESFYKARWDAASAFDLVVDTSKVSPDLATAWLVAAAKALDGRPAGDRPTCSLLQVIPSWPKRLPMPSSETTQSSASPAACLATSPATRWACRSNSNRALAAAPTRWPRCAATAPTTSRPAPGPTTAR